VGRIAELDQLEHIAFRIAAVGRAHRAGRAGLGVEAHARRAQPGIFRLDIVHCEAEMGEAGVADGAIRIARRRRRCRIGEQFEIGVPLAQHPVARRRARQRGERVMPHAARLPFAFRHDLEAQQVPVEAEHGLQIDGRDADMMEPQNHLVSPHDGPFAA